MIEIPSPVFRVEVKETWNYSNLYGSPIPCPSLDGVRFSPSPLDVADPPKQIGSARVFLALGDTDTVVWESGPIGIGHRSEDWSLENFAGRLFAERLRSALQ